MSRAGRVAVVGLGLAGAVAASALAAGGIAVRAFEKSRGPGGRMATRRHEAAGATLRFDHGAPAFEVTSAEFVDFLEQAETAGAASRWRGRGRDEWCGTPRMNALVRYAAQGLPDEALGLQREVEALERDGSGWLARCADGEEGPFEAVIVTTPAPQAVPLLAASERLRQAAAAVRYAPCWTLMLAWSKAAVADLRQVRAAIANDLGANLIVDHDKPGRADAATLVAHLSDEWSANHLELDRAAVLARWVPPLCEALALPLPHTALAHRWRFANPTVRATLSRPFDETMGLAVAGDWIASEAQGVEAAFMAGRRVAEALQGR